MPETINRLGSDTKQACPDGASRGIGVAYEVGFSNLSYFSKVFKEEFGVLPSEYEAKSI